MSDLTEIKARSRLNLPWYLRPLTSVTYVYAHLPDVIATDQSVSKPQASHPFPCPFNITFSYYR